MKKSNLILAVFGSLSLCCAAESSMASRFELCRQIDGEFTAGQVGRVSLPGDVFAQCRSFPDDLRILDAAGKQWPFYLSVARSQVESRGQLAEIVNASFVDAEERYWQFDLVIPAVDGKVQPHNQLELRSSGNGYVRRVEVFTAREPRGHMATGYLIRSAHHRNAGNRLVRYPASDAARLHVRVYANAKDATETFSVTRANVLHKVATTAERETVEYKALDVPENETTQTVQTFLFDTGFENRPVEFISFNVKTASFVRSVTVQGRNRENEPWQRLGGAGIHRYGDESKAEITLRANKRFLKIDIHHYDDVPLAVEAVKLEAIPRHLVFEAASAASASLCFRAWDMPTPRYDLEARLSKQTMAEAPLYPTLETRPNEAAKAQPWRKYSKLLAGLAVGLVSLLVIRVIIGMMKQQAGDSQG
ncbi:hypothetical protein PDESU_05619 [Pontiella desulfatans]|uniref:DUF3999 domain-containing protein n=1 Tax=Pontiella desulfatans TaxID=2750659 RepID=A0A6C2UAJ3_PONDE|nr:DUF3999 domain-containing protein [Pontiella desulfatans]VGO17025.1 hypothetical protein PDESU_05619 [Pontiella desulfatans]